MSTTVIFTTNSTRNGTLAKIVFALIKMGIKPGRHTIKQPPGKDYYLIEFDLKANRPITVQELSQIKKSLPMITRIEKVAESVQVPVDPKQQLKMLGQRLVNAYPAINKPLLQIERDLDPAIRDDVLLRLGNAVGKWQYQKNYALGGHLSLNKTLQRMVWPALEDFLRISKGAYHVSVFDCPHCAVSRVPTSPDCYFILGFIEGFLKAIPYLSDAQVIQSSSRALDGKQCIFKVLT